MERDVKIFMHSSPEISCYSSILKTHTDTQKLQHEIFCLSPWKISAWFRLQWLQTLTIAEYKVPRHRFTTTTEEKLFQATLIDIYMCTTLWCCWRFQFPTSETMPQIWPVMWIRPEGESTWMSSRHGGERDVGLWGPRLLPLIPKILGYGQIVATGSKLAGRGVPTPWAFPDQFLTQ